MVKGMRRTVNQHSTLGRVSVLGWFTERVLGDSTMANLPKVRSTSMPLIYVNIHVAIPIPPTVL